MGNDFCDLTTEQLAEKLEKLVDNFRGGSKQVIGVVVSELLVACAERLMSLARK